MSKFYEALRREGLENLPPPEAALEELENWQRQQVPPGWGGAPPANGQPNGQGSAQPNGNGYAQPNGNGYAQPNGNGYAQPNGYGYAHQAPVQQAPAQQPLYQVHAPAGSIPSLWMLELDRWPYLIESFRAVKNAMVHVNRHHSHKAFLFTGPDNKIGTSVVAFNTALMMAWDLADQNIVVVDANLTSPSLHLAFGLAEGPGLNNLLLEDIALEDATQASPLPNLDLITIGQSSQTAASPFDLEIFRFLVEELKRKYDYIIFDSAPALKSSQTRTIASKVDGSVVVARANRTRWEVIQELKRVLEADGATLLGSVLNKRQFVIPQGLYRYL